MASITPVAKTLFLCEEIDVEWGMTNLYGLLNILRPAGYPHTQESFSAFLQLSQGLGEMSFHIDIRRARDYRLIRASTPRRLNFQDRSQVLQVVTHFEGVYFEEPGVYLVELFCDNTWVGDVTLLLAGGVP